MRHDQESDFNHVHVFDAGNPAAERGTRAVIWITAITMVVEIVAGWWFNSMALLADGWHMSSHVVALGVSAFAYAAARRLARDPRYAFGTWKIEVLGGFASAMFLLGVAVLMVVASIERFLSPETIRYQQAMLVAALGLAVNLLSAWILGAAHHHHDHGDHHHDHHEHEDHDHAHHERHQDLNLKSAYIHVITDALTSVLAIVALAGGWLYGWDWLDPLMGIVGAVLVGNWARGLIIETARVLLDREMDHPVVQEIRAELVALGNADDIRIDDMHVWRAGKRSYYAIISLSTSNPSLTPQQVHQALAKHDEIAHITAEIRLRAD